MKKLVALAFLAILAGVSWGHQADAPLINPTFKSLTIDSNGNVQVTIQAGVSDTLQLFFVGDSVPGCGELFWHAGFLKYTKCGSNDTVVIENPSAAGDDSTKWLINSDTSASHYLTADSAIYYTDNAHFILKSAAGITFSALLDTVGRTNALGFVTIVGSLRLMVDTATSGDVRVFYPFDTTLTGGIPNGAGPFWNTANGQFEFTVPTGGGQNLGADTGNGGQPSFTIPLNTVFGPDTTTQAKFDDQTPDTLSVTVVKIPDGAVSGTGKIAQHVVDTSDLNVGNTGGADAFLTNQLSGAMEWTEAATLGGAGITVSAGPIFNVGSDSTISTSATGVAVAKLPDSAVSGTSKIMEGAVDPSDLQAGGILGQTPTFSSSTAWTWVTPSLSGHAHDASYWNVNGEAGTLSGTYSPTVDGSGNLGTPTNSWGDLYAQGTVDFSGAAVTFDAGEIPGSELTQGDVDSTELKNKGISTGDLDDTSVTGPKIDTHAIDTSKLNVNNLGTVGQVLTNAGSGVMAWANDQTGTGGTAQRLFVDTGDISQPPVPLSDSAVLGGDSTIWWRYDNQLRDTTRPTVVKIPDGAVSSTAKMSDGVVDPADLQTGGGAGQVPSYSSSTAWAWAVYNLFKLQVDTGNGSQAAFTVSDTTILGPDSTIQVKFDDQTTDTLTFTVVKIPDNSADSSKIVNKGVSTADLQDTSVTTAKILTANVTLAKLASNSVDSSKIVDKGISTGDLQDTSVTTAKILTGNVTLAKLASNSVDSSKLVDKGISTGDLQDTSVTTAKILTGNVTLAKLAANSVDSSKIVDKGVSTADLQDTAVTAIKIKSSVVDSNKVLDKGLSTADYQDTSVTSAKVATGAVTLGKMASNSVDSSKIVDKGIATGDLQDTSVTTAKILTANVTLAKLASNSVDSSKIVDKGISTGDLQDTLVTAAKIKTAVVDSFKILDKGISTGDLQDTAVTAAKIKTAVVDSFKILDKGISTGDLQDTSVTSAKIKSGAITTAKILDGDIQPHDVDEGTAAAQNDVPVRGSTDADFDWIASSGSGRFARSSVTWGPWVWLYSSTTTDVDPGSGGLKMNNTAIPSVTFIYIDTISLAGVEVGDSTFAEFTTNDMIWMEDINSPSNGVLFRVTGGGTNGTGYWKIPVAVMDSATIGQFTANDTLACSFLHAVNQGSVYGVKIGSTNNATDYAYFSGSNDFMPSANYTFNLGNSSTGWWANIFTASLYIKPDGVTGNIYLPSQNNTNPPDRRNIVIDSNNYAITMTDGAVDYAIAQKIKTAQMTIDDPESIVRDTIPILYVDSSTYPAGITIVSCGVTSDNTTRDSVTFYEGSDLTTVASTIETLAGAVTAKREDDGTLSDASVATNTFVLVRVGRVAASTKIVWITYYVNES